MSKLRGRAKEMRSQSTDAEHRLWQVLRAHRFAGFRQHAESARDERRDGFLRKQGFRVLRIWNNDLFTNEEGVAELILSALRLPPLPNPSPAGGEGLNGVSNG